WGKAAAGDPMDGRHADADVSLGYLEGTLLSRRLALRVGRQLIIGGAARPTQLDGARVEARLPGGVGVTLYGGAPVTPRFAVHRGDALAGARLFWRPRLDAEVGASFVEGLDRGRSSRRDAGVDARWVPLAPVTLTGYGLWSLVEQRLAEVDVSSLPRPH